MKRFIAVLLCLVMVFSMSVPSFAVTADEQADDLSSGWGSSTTTVTYPVGYGSSWFYKVAILLREILADTADMRDNSVSVESKVSLLYNLVNGQIKENISDSRGFLYSISESVKGFDTDLSDIVSNTSSINTSVNNLVSDIDTINLYLDNTLNAHLNDLNGYLNLIKDDVSMLQQVLADEDDLALKNSQKDNQEAIEESFFNSDSDLSINTSKIGCLSYLANTFVQGIDLSKYGNGSPLEYLGEGSEFASWFTEETGLDMDPTFSPSSGDDNFPWPDVPDNPDNPDVPDVPETTPTPTITYNESTYTVSASGSGTVVMYVDGIEVSNPYTFTQGETDVTYVVTATAQDGDKLISDTARLEVTVIGQEPEPVPETTPTPTIIYNESTFTVSASGSGTVVMYVDGVEVSNPYTFTRFISSATYVVTATSKEVDKLISDTARFEVVVSPLSGDEVDYVVIGTFGVETGSPTLTISEAGWYQAEVFGASGNAGRSWGYFAGYNDSGVPYGIACGSGGSGGGGGYACSRVYLNVGDTVRLVPGNVSQTTSVLIESTFADYPSIHVDSATNGTDGSHTSAGQAGLGGPATGGNVSNISGNNGYNGIFSTTSDASGVRGGSPAVADGNSGGASQTAKKYPGGTWYTGGSGQAGYITIYRGSSPSSASTFSLRSPTYFTVSYSPNYSSFYSQRNEKLLDLLFGGD